MSDSLPDELRFLVDELLDDGVWPREILDLLQCWVEQTPDNAAAQLQQLQQYVRDDYCGGNLNNPDVPAFRLRSVREDTVS